MDGICDNADPDDDNDDIPDECDIDSTGGADCNDNGVDDKIGRASCRERV